MPDGGEGRALEISVEPLLLAADDITSLGLITGELVMNAFKHARGGVGIVVRRNGGTLEITVADEGSGNFGTLDPNNPYADAQAEVGNGYTGLQKWVFNQTTKSWQLAYVLQNGLDLGQPYTVAGYPTGDNSTEGGSGLPWAPATDGLRNISGRVNGDGTVTVYATTSTVSGSGDQGADPNKVVAITDRLGAPSPGNERFKTIRAARYGVRYGGVAVLPRSFGKDQHGR